MTDQELILNALRGQLEAIEQTDPTYWSGYKVILSLEQQFVRPQDRGKGAIYIVAKTLPATINFGQRVVPVTINAVAERNRLEACQRLLSELAATYNLQSSEEDGTIVKQAYTTPAVSSNFNEVFDGYRSLFYMSATFLLSSNANTFDLEWKDGTTWEAAETLTSHFSLDAQNDVQATYAGGGFTTARPMIATLTVGFTTYLTQDGLPAELLSILADRDLTKTVSLRLNFKSGQSIEGEFRLQQMSGQQNIGEIPAASFTLTE